jgi:hypothetical protein
VQGCPYTNAKGCNARRQKADRVPSIGLREERRLSRLQGCISAQNKWWGLTEAGKAVPFAIESDNSVQRDFDACRLLVGVDGLCGIGVVSESGCGQELRFHSVRRGVFFPGNLFIGSPLNICARCFGHKKWADIILPRRSVDFYGSDAKYNAKCT